MSRHYFLSPTAELDLDEIITYLAHEAPKSAYAFLDSIYDAMDMLAANPEIGHAREELTEKPVKFWTFKWHYLIVYKPVKPIEIVRVLSGYRDIFNLMGE